MNRLVVAALGVVLTTAAALPAATAATPGAGHPGAHDAHGAKPSCSQSSKPVVAVAAPVKGWSSQQILTATGIINEGAKLQVPQHGQTLAVMTALQASSLGDQATTGLFGVGSQGLPKASQHDPAASAQNFYQQLDKVKSWEDLPPTLAAHAAQHNLDPQAYAHWWPKAVTLVDQLTTGTGVAGLQNLAARAQAIADCEQATLRGRFALNKVKLYVGPLTPDLLVSRAVEYATHGDPVWFERCQAFVANLDGRPRSGYSTALDAWQTFEAEGVAHPVTSADGVAPPPGAWLYYSGTNPAGHVVTYLGGGKIASTDVFGVGRVGIGPTSAITDGPWHLQYLGWAPPWGQR